MPALTTFIAGISALASMEQASTAKRTASRQAAAQKQQKLKLDEELKLASQDKAVKVADVALGTNKVSDELLKRKKVSKDTTTSVSVGGLTSGSATKVGGL